MPRGKRDLRALDISIGKRVKNARVMRGYSRAQLAAAVGISHQQLAKYETGENRITAGRLYCIAEFLNYPLISFVKDEHEEPVFMPQDRLFTEIARNFVLLRSRRQQKALNILLQSMTEEEPHEKDN